MDEPTQSSKESDGAIKRALSDSELNDKEVESTKRLKTQHRSTALPIRQKSPSTSTPVPELSKAENDDQVVAGLVALVRNSALASHQHLPVRSFLVANSATCRAAPAETVTLWMQRVMCQVRAEDGIAARLNKDRSVLPGWPRDNIIPELTGLVRNACPPALDDSCVGAYLREVYKGVEEATLEKGIRCVVQRFQ